MLCFKTTDWLQKHLLTCPFKRLTGMDCPGCGFQRSLIELIRGNFQHSFVLYPATVPLAMLFLFSIADPCFKAGTKVLSNEQCLSCVQRWLWQAIALKCAGYLAISPHLPGR